MDHFGNVAALEHSVDCYVSFRATYLQINHEHANQLASFRLSQFSSFTYTYLTLDMYFGYILYILEFIAFRICILHYALIPDLDIEGTAYALP